MEEIIVRPAAPGDLDAVWALVRRAVQKMREEGSEQWGEDYPTRADYEEDLRRGRLAAAVSAQGQVLGCACITDEPETAYAGVPWAVEGPALVVHRVAVDPALQRGGVASALLTYAEDWAGPGVSRSFTPTPTVKTAKCRRSSASGALSSGVRSISPAGACPFPPSKNCCDTCLDTLALHFFPKPHIMYSILTER